MLLHISSIRIISVYLAASYFFPAHLLLMCTNKAISILFLSFTILLVLYVFSLRPLLLPLHKQNTAFNVWPSMDMWDWSSFSVVLIIESVFHWPLHESMLWILSYKCVRSSLAPLTISTKLGTLTLTVKTACVHVPWMWQKISENFWRLKEFISQKTKKFI